MTGIVFEKKGHITPEELMAQLSKNPQYVKMMKEREQKRLKIVAKNKKDSRPILQDLAKAGFKVSYICDLHNRKLCYEDAIPVLMKWLPKIENMDIKEAIVGALSIKWAIANALEVVVDDSVFYDIVRLVNDKQHGDARQMLAVALGNMRDPNAVDVLIELLKDEDVAGHAIMGLRKLKAKETRRHIEPFLEYPKTWVRKEAQKAIKAIDKKKTK